jgi:hypothetical protein
MSSATSIDGNLPLKPEAANPQAGPGATGPDTKEPEDQSFRPAHFFVMASLILATAAVVMSRQTTPANLILISLAIGAAGAAAAGMYRMLAPLVMSDISVLRDRPSVRQRDALQREKTLVLRSIKELEFDRAMRKISERDFDEMASRLRARAMMLMKQLDEGTEGYRDLIERDLKAYIREAGPGRTKETVPSRSAPAPAAEAAPITCVCGAVNDADAAFCKRCGTKLVAA